MALAKATIWLEDTLTEKSDDANDNRGDTFQDLGRQ
jgi:hypothetical protein